MRRTIAAFGHVSRERNLVLAALAAALLAMPTPADGTEALGQPTIDIASGTGLILAGVGLAGQQPGQIDISIPENAGVVQVIAYWEGLARFAWQQGDTDVISIGGQSVVGERIGGVTYIGGHDYTSTYRADVTALGLVGPGDNALLVEGLDFQSMNDGVGIAVIVDDGSQGTTAIEVRDGSDYALENFVAPLDDTVLQTYSFEPHAEDRDAELSLILGHVSSLSSSVVEVWVDGVLSEELHDVLGELDGPNWDTYTHALTVPAGATSVGVRPVSRDSVVGPRAGNGAASLTWVLASLELTTAAPQPQRNGDEGCGPWVWALSPELWDGGPESVTEDVHSSSSFNGIMGLDRRTTGLTDRTTLMDALWFRFRGFRWQRILNRQVSAALANADSGIDYTYTVDEVVAMYRDATGADPGPETVRSLLVRLFQANVFRKHCPLR